MICTENINRTHDLNNVLKDICFVSINVKLHLHDFYSFIQLQNKYD